MLQTLSVTSRNRCELIDITDSVQEVIARSSIQDGSCLLFVPHTTAAVTINEGADPSVREDLLAQLSVLAPPNAAYRHREGNAGAHIKATLVGASEQVIIRKGKLVLGTWQAIFFCEFDGPRQRKVNVLVHADRASASGS
ncbi:MAG: secondary thiamine-phosphate synthase enzyme YjbQ [bacterium]